MVTNLLGGWIAARLGLKITLYAGLLLQIVALVMLSLLEPAWPHAASVAYVVTAQGLAGVAKDLTKMSSKSAVKLAAGAEQVHGFIRTHLDRLNGEFGVSLRRAPAYSSVRFILHGLDADEMERVFREHAAGLAEASVKGAAIPPAVAIDEECREFRAGPGRLSIRQPSPL